MKAATQFLKNYLNTGQQFVFAELYTFTLADGTVLRYATAGGDIRLPANLVPFSEQADQWILSNATVTPNQGTPPDGSATADNLIEDSTPGSIHTGSTAFATVSAAAQDLTASMFCRLGSRTWVGLQMIENGVGTGVSCYFNLATGAIGSSVFGAGWSSCAPKIVNWGNGWYRCSISARKISAGTGVRLVAYLATGNAVAVYNGNGLGYIQVWGASIDTASSPTDYVPSLAAAVPSRTFDASSLVLTRGAVKTTIGIEVATLSVDVTAAPSHLIGSTPWLQALRQGALDGASVLLERLVMPTFGDYHLGTLIVFGGRVADMSFGRYDATLTVNSDMELLNIAFPRNVYQPGCLNTLFDNSCTLVKASFGVAGAILAGTTNILLYTGLANPVGWFASGTLTFTSGALNGVSVGLKDYSVVGRLSLYEPLNALPAVGDTFIAYPGCPKSQSACTNADPTAAPAFNNLIHFRGFPYVPAPETTT